MNCAIPKSLIKASSFSPLIIANKDGKLQNSSNASGVGTNVRTNRKNLNFVAIWLDVLRSLGSTIQYKANKSDWLRKEELNGS